MRDLVIDFVENNLPTGFNVTPKLPWVKDGAPLFLKNNKTIYVDRESISNEPLFDTLDGQSAVDEITTVSVYVATDAKTLPSTYETLVSTLRAGRLDPSFVGNTQKTTSVSTSYEGDTLVSQFDFTFRKFNM